MQKPTYTFDTDGHTVVEGDSAKNGSNDPLYGMPFYLKPLFRFMIWIYCSLARRRP